MEEGEEAGLGFGTAPVRRREIRIYEKEKIKFKGKIFTDALKYR